MRGCICDTEPSTSCLPRNVYHMHVPLFVLDVVRLFQDHPKFVCGLKECHIVDMFEKQSFACGDVAAQVKMALKELQTAGFLRAVHKGYRTLGPFAKLSLARTPRQFCLAWDKISALQKVSSTSLNSSTTS